MHVADKLTPGVEAPNFDLTSTEDVVLMLRDEVPRVAVVLYFFADPESDRCRQDLQALAGAQAALAAKRAVILGVSRTKLDALKQAQHDLDLRFPLLFDDRNFSAAYGIEVPEEGEPESALFVVDRDQTALIRLLEKQGLDVVPLKLRHSRMLGGGFHCVTLDIRRRGTFQRYFD